MIKSDIVCKRIRKIQLLKDIKLLKYELYSIFSELILSKEQFKSNAAVSEFLKDFKIEYKPYVISTRTLILAKTIRRIQDANFETLMMYKDVLINMLNTDDKKDNDKITNNSSYIESILKKYSRNKDK